MARRGSRRRFRTLRLPSSELIRMRSSSTAIQTGELLGEPSGMIVEIRAKLGREGRARTGGSGFMVRTSAKLYALRPVARLAGRGPRGLHSLGADGHYVIGIGFN